MKTPAPEARLILLSAATAARREQCHSEMEGLADLVDWSRLEAILASRRLLPLLGNRMLKALGHRVPRSFARAVEQKTIDARQHGRFLQLAGRNVREALSDVGIRCLDLKGPTLGEVLYGDPGHRMSSDIDLLVSPSDLARAVDVVQGLGYGYPDDPSGPDGLPLLHFVMRHANGLLPDVELHWRVHWNEREFARDMLERSSVNRVLGRIPTPVDGFISLLLFYARDGFIDVRLVTDLVGWWEAFKLQLDPGALDDTVRRYPALSRALWAALTVVEDLTGLPARQLADTPGRLETRVRLAVRLANPNPTQSVTQLHADMALVDWLLTPKDAQLRFLRRQILISWDVLEYRARRAQRDKVGSPLGHGSRVLARNALAVPRLLRGSRL